MNSKQPIQDLDGHQCLDALEAKLNRINGVITILQAALEQKTNPINLPNSSQYAASALLDLTEECQQITQRLFRLGAGRVK